MAAWLTEAEGCISACCPATPAFPDAVDRDSTERFAEIDAAIARTEEHLRVIAQQNATLSKMVEILGGFVSVNTDLLTRHLRDDHLTSSSGRLPDRVQLGREPARLDPHVHRREQLHGS